MKGSRRIRFNQLFKTKPDLHPIHCHNRTTDEKGNSHWNWTKSIEIDCISMSPTPSTLRFQIRWIERCWNWQSAIQTPSKSMLHKQRTVNPFCKMNERNTSIYYIWFDSLSFNVNLTEKCIGILSRSFFEFICSLLKCVKFRIFALCNVKDEK